VPRVAGGVGKLYWCHLKGANEGMDTWMFSKLVVLAHESE